MSPPLFRDLDPQQRIAIERRCLAAGLPLIYDDQNAGWTGFHGCGTYLSAGTLRWSRRSEADTVIHEAAHALLLPPGERALHDRDEIPTEEEATMILQVELLRGIPGLGVATGLRWMREVGYEMYSPTGRDTVTIEYWWRNRWNYTERRAQIEELVGAWQSRA